MNNNMNCFLTGILAVLGLFFTAAAHAQQPMNAPGDEVTTSAFPASPTSSPAVTSDDIERTTATTPSDLLQQLPGVYIQYPLPQAGSLQLRGHSGARNIIRIDGVRYANSLYGSGPGSALSSIRASFIHDIQLRKGPATFFSANGNIGGVIDISTNDKSLLTPGAHGNGEIYFSSGTHTPGLQTGIAMIQESHTLTADASFLAPGDIRTGDGDKLPYTGSQQANWMSKVILRPADSAVEVTGAYLGQITYNRARTEELGNGTIHDADTQDHLVYVGVNWKPNGIFKKVSVVASYHQMIEMAERYNCRLTVGKQRINHNSCATLSEANSAQKSHDTVDTFGIDASSLLALYADRLFLQGNIEYYFDNVISSLETARIEDGNSTILLQNRGLYSSGSYFSSLGTSLGVHAELLRTAIGSLWVQLGGRYSYYAAYAPVVPNIDEDIHNTYSGFTDTASVSWNYADLLSIYGSFSTGFRPPSLQESTALGYVAGTWQIPSPTLEPEVSTGFELGSYLSFRPVRVGTVWFHQRMDDYIDERPAVWNGVSVRTDGTRVIERYNANHATFEGVENSLEILLGNFTLFGTVSWQRSRVFDDTEGLMAELTQNANSYPVRRAPTLYGSAGLRYVYPSGRFFSAIRMNWADRLTELHPLDRLDLAVCERGRHTGQLKSNCDGFAGYYTFRIDGGVTLTPNADIVVSLQNILDRQYKTIGSTYVAPGFDAQTSFRVHF